MVAEGCVALSHWIARVAGGPKGRRHPRVTLQARAGGCALGTAAPAAHPFEAVGRPQLGPQRVPERRQALCGAVAVDRGVPRREQLRGALDRGGGRRPGGWACVRVRVAWGEVRVRGAGRVAGEGGGGGVAVLRSAAWRSCGARRTATVPVARPRAAPASAPTSPPPGGPPVYHALRQRQHALAPRHQLLCLHNDRGVGPQHAARHLLGQRVGANAGRPGHGGEACRDVPGAAAQQSAAQQRPQNARGAALRRACAPQRRRHSLPLW